MSTDTFRRCAKCGVSPRGMYIMHRFPKPGKTNLLRAKAWAKYCWPDKDWNSVEELKTLYRKNRVLCKNHFEDSCFTNSNKNRLHKFSVPGDKESAMKLIATLRKEAILQEQEQRKLSVVEEYLDESYLSVSSKQEEEEEEEDQKPYYIASVDILPSNKPGKNKWMIKQPNPLDKACPSENVQTPPANNSYPLALSWAQKLESLKPAQRLYAEKCINDILAVAQLGHLDDSTVNSISF